MSETLFSKNIKVFMFCFRLFGLAPFYQNPVLNIILACYSLLHICLLIILIFSAFLWTDVFGDALSSLSSIVGRLVFCGLVITHIMIIFQAFLYRHEQKLFLQKFQDIDNLFKTKLFTPINYSSRKKRQAIKIIFIVGVLVGIQCIFLISLIYYNTFAMYWIHCFFSMYAIRFRCIQNIFYVDLVQDCLQLLLTNLDDIINNNKSKSKLNMILFVEKYQNPEFKNYNKPIYDQLLVLKDIYGKIWDVTNLINDCFGWSLLAIATQNFIEFTCNGYWIFLALEGLINISAFTYSSCANAQIVFTLVMLAFSCYSCSQTCIRVGGLIHKIEKDVKDELHNSLVREFSLQIIHEPITISANGFFNINFTLLGSMAAATVTYLVILIQFQLSEKKKTGS